MKKIIIFVTIIFSVFLTGFITAEAEASFYEGEFISNIWMVRKKNNRLIYQTARFLRRSGDNQVAYCAEPFSLIQNNQLYSEIINPDNIPKATWDKVALIAYFGYGYDNHSTDKWYPITQIMIWRELDPTSEFYFTDSLNGNKIDIFTQEISEIEYLIQKYYQNPSFSNQTISAVLGSTIKLNDQNFILNKYKLTTSDKDVHLNDNTLQITATKVGTKDIFLERRENNHQAPPIFYYHPTSQNLMTAGSIPTKNTKVSIETIETKVIINKLDKDTKSKENSGEAKLEGAKYQIYNKNNEVITTVTINEEKEATIENLDFGTYYIKEINPGIGYQLDNETYEFKITNENPKIILELENEVIKSKIEIHKKYGNPKSNKMLPEADITFDIYNINNVYITSLTTDKFGFGSVILPYGTYVVKQRNTTEGYQKIDDFKIIINENSEDLITYNLDNLEIPVPNTKEDKNYTKLFLSIILGSISIHYAKKENHNPINIAC